MDYLELLYGIYRKPKHKGSLSDAVVGEEYSEGCGDHFKVYLREKDGKLEAKFEGQGCVISTASVSLLLDKVNSFPKEKVEQLTEEDVLNLLPVDLSFNPQRRKCALVGFKALKKALAKLLSSGK